MTDGELLKHVSDTLESHSKMIMTFMSGEVDGVRKEVKEVKDEFRAMNGRLRDVCEWKAAHEGQMQQKERWGAKHIAIAAVIVALLGVAINFAKLI
jgi:hypothetical protein